MHLEVPAKAVAEAGDRSRGRAEHSDLRHPIRRPPQPLDKVPRPLRRRPVVDAANHHPHDAAVGRIEESLAGGQFIADKRFVVVGRRGADRRMVGRARLHDHAAAERPAATAARHLGDELAGPLRGAEVGQVQRRVGVDHAHEHHVREVEPLRDHLRAHEDVDLPVAKGIERPLVAAAGPHGVGVHPRHGRVGERGPHLLFQPLRAGAGVDEAGRVAVGTVGRQPRHQSAAMADAAVARLVEREGEVALVAAGRVAAGPALNVRGKAAAVEQQHHLPAGVERPADAGGQPWAHRATGTAASFTEIDRDHRGKLPAPDAIGEAAHRPLARETAGEGLERRRGRAEHQWHSLGLRDPLGHVAGVVAGRRRLLERALVFLVDHDQAEPRSGSEDRRPRAHHHVHPARGDLPPLGVSLGCREVAVEHGHRAKPGTKPVAGLRGEADLGHEHDRLPAIRHGLLDGLQVDLRLAAARDAEEYDRLVPLGGHRVFDGDEAARLRGRELRGPVVNDRRPLGFGPAGPLHGARLGEEAELHQPLHHRAAGSAGLRKLVGGLRLGRGGEHLRLSGRQLPRRLSPRCHQERREPHSVA